MTLAPRRQVLLLQIETALTSQAIYIHYNINFSPRSIYRYKQNLFRHFLLSAGALYKENTNNQGRSGPRHIETNF